MWSQPAPTWNYCEAEMACQAEMAWQACQAGTGEMVQRARKGRLDHRGRKEREETRDHQDHKVSKVPLDHMVQLDQLVHREQWGRKETEERQACRDLREGREPVDQRVLRDLSGQKVNRGPWGKRGPLDKKVRREHKVESSTHAGGSRPVPVSRELSWCILGQDDPHTQECSNQSNTFKTPATNQMPLATNQIIHCPVEAQLLPYKKPRTQQ